MPAPSVGYYDANGIWHAGYTDVETRFADHLEKISQSTSDAIAGAGVDIATVAADLADFIAKKTTRSYDTVASASFANNATILTVTIASAAFDRVIDFAWLGTIGNAAGSDQSGRVVPSVSAGTLTIGGNTNAVRVHNGFYAAYAVQGVIALPAGTACTLTFKAAAGTTLIYEGTCRTTRFAT